jgi:hypothetical protein
MILNRSAAEGLRNVVDFIVLTFASILAFLPSLRFKRIIS